MSSESSLHQLQFSPPSLENVGQLLPSYQFEHLIAAGGMGAVYKTIQTSLERNVAIKILAPELSNSVSFRSSFEKEAKLMARLNHPNLIGVYDFGEVDGMLFIAMEYVDGTSLYEKTHSAILEQTEALEVILGICEGLANAHKAGILHRDIKPANIFITSEGIPKIGDFGLARPSGDQETGVIFGTPGYTAPEVTAHPEKVGPATDIFSIGVMLYELLTARLPDEVYQPITGVTPAIDPIVRKAICPNPDFRYQSAQELANEIKPLLHSLQQSSVVAAKFKTAPVSQTNTSPVSAARRSTPPASFRKKQKSPLLNNILIILILVAAIFGVLKWKEQKDAENNEITTHNKTVKPKIIVLDRPAPVEKEVANNDAKIPLIEEPASIAPAEILPKRQSKPKNEGLEFLARLNTGNNALFKKPDQTAYLEDDTRLVVFVDKNLTWAQADRWCHARGGHLVTLKSAEDIAAVLPLIPDSETVWIGAATTGKQRWAWSDGSPWENHLKLPKEASLAFALLNSDETFSIKKSHDKSSFLIEWELDGSTPAALQNRMRRAAQGSPQGDAQYPASTFAVGKHHYYLCPIPMTLQQAKEAAAKAGAHIATPSSVKELAYFKAFIPKNIPSGKLCRIGAERDNNQWRWINNEKWNLTNWAKGYPKKHTSLAVVSKREGPWKDIDSNELAPYTLFEWSSDKL